jgi:hypothetical protein
VGLRTPCSVHTHRMHVWQEGNKPKAPVHAKREKSCELRERKRGSKQQTGGSRRGEQGENVSPLLSRVPRTNYALLLLLLLTFTFTFYGERGAGAQGEQREK